MSDPMHDAVALARALHADPAIGPNVTIGLNGHWRPADSLTPGECPAVLVVMGASDGAAAKVFARFDKPPPQVLYDALPFHVAAGRIGGVEVWIRMTSVQAEAAGQA